MKEKGNCYGCRFAMDMRDHMRLGEQVRCAKAEELFGVAHVKGNQRWVDVRRGVKGQLLNSKCGQFESFVGDVVVGASPIVKGEKCGWCAGTGKTQVRVMDKNVAQNCSNCDGAGEVGQIG